MFSLQKVYGITKRCLWCLLNYFFKNIFQLIIFITGYRAFQNFCCNYHAILTYFFNWCQNLTLCVETIKFCTMCVMRLYFQVKKWYSLQKKRRLICWRMLERSQTRVLRATAREFHKKLRYRFGNCTKKIFKVCLFRTKRSERRAALCAIVHKLYIRWNSQPIFLITLVPLNIKGVCFHTPCSYSI